MINGCDIHRAVEEAKIIEAEEKRIKEEQERIKKEQKRQMIEKQQLEKTIEFCENVLSPKLESVINASLNCDNFTIPGFSFVKTDEEFPMFCLVTEVEKWVDMRRVSRKGPYINLYRDEYDKNICFNKQMLINYCASHNIGVKFTSRQTKTKIYSWAAYESQNRYDGVIYTPIFSIICPKEKES